MTLIFALDAGGHDATDAKGDERPERRRLLARKMSRLFAVIERNPYHAAMSGLTPDKRGGRNGSVQRLLLSE